MAESGIQWWAYSLPCCGSHPTWWGMHRTRFSIGLGMVGNYSTSTLSWSPIRNSCIEVCHPQCMAFSARRCFLWFRGKRQATCYCVHYINWSLPTDSWPCSLCCGTHCLRCDSCEVFRGASPHTSIWWTIPRVHEDCTLLDSSARAHGKKERTKLNKPNNSGAFLLEYFHKMSDTHNKSYPYKRCESEPAQDALFLTKGMRYTVVCILGL